MWSTLKKTLDRALFPARCAYCNEVIASDRPVCGGCAAALKGIGPACPNCGYQLSDCSCRKRQREYRAVTAPFYYEGLPKQAVHSLKFYNHGYIADEMALRMSDKIKTDFHAITFDCITGVPLARKRQRMRGFNQADLIAMKIGQRLMIPFAPLLKKIFETEPQHDLPASRRGGNVVGAYDAISPALVNEKRILLIDDVLTTGATMNECARTLKAYGAKEVYCAVFTVTKWSKKDAPQCERKRE